MRGFNILILVNILILGIVALLTACEPNDQYPYRLDIEQQVSCPYSESSIEIEYTITGSEGSVTGLGITATSDAEWITALNTSVEGLLTVGVEQNFGDERSATIKLTAPAMSPAEIRLTQLAKREDIVEHCAIHYFFGTSLGRYFNTNVADAATAIAEGALGSENRYVYLKQSSRSEASIVEICYDATNGSAVERHIADIIIDATKSNAENIAANIALIMEAIPAESYGIILAGHGQGWVTREVLNSDNATEFAAKWGYDPWAKALGAEQTRAFGEYNTQSDITELAEGLRLEGGEKFDYLLFDACFMSNIETLYDLSNVAEVIIASPCEIMGSGFPYHRTLRYLMAGEERSYERAAESYYLYYRDEYSGSARCGSIALVECSQIEALAEATRAVVATAREQYDATTIQTYEGQYVHTFYDFAQWCEAVATDEAAYQAFEQQLARTIPAKYTLPTFYSALGSGGTLDIDVERYSGVTTSAPCEPYQESWRETSWYKAVWE